MAPRYRHKARGQCPLAPTGISCHAFGRENSCQLCEIIDFDHPTTVVSLGNTGMETRADLAERQFYEHMARGYGGGNRSHPGGR